MKLKFGNDLPVMHSVNVRLKEAIEAIAAETNGKVTINLFPNNQLGSDTDMMTQLRSGALELATMPGTRDVDAHTDRFADRCRLCLHQLRQGVGCDGRRSRQVHPR